MEIQMKVHLDLAGLAKVNARVKAGLLRGQGNIGKAFKQWGVRYRSAMQERFDTFSKGGGDWAPLAESTIERRRHGKGGGYKRGRKALERAKATGGGKVSILRDTGTLFAALDPEFSNKPGAMQKVVPYGINVGFGGTRRYAGKGTTATIADIAGFHQFGGGRLPARPILVEPEQPVVERMAADLTRAVKRDISESER